MWTSLHDHLPVLITSGALLIPVSAIGEDFQMTGKVVVYRGNAGVENVAVEVRYSEAGRSEKSVVTGPDGDYSFKVPGTVAHVFLAYRPRDPAKYATEGRSWVANNASPKMLDTVGLVELSKADKMGWVGAIRGAYNYGTASGDQGAARSTLFAAKKAFPRFNDILKDSDPRLHRALEREGLLP